MQKYTTKLAFITGFQQNTVSCLQQTLASIASTGWEKQKQQFQLNQNLTKLWRSDDKNMQNRTEHRES